MSKANLKKLRNEFRNAVFKRDKNKCVFCQKPAVDAHHITDRNQMPNGGYVDKNGISLCALCHMKAESFHQSRGAYWYAGYNPEDLYRKINSSYKEALEKAQMY